MTHRQAVLKTVLSKGSTFSTAWTQSSPLWRIASPMEDTQAARTKYLRTVLSKGSTCNTAWTQGSALWRIGMTHRQHLQYCCRSIEYELLQRYCKCIAMCMCTYVNMHMHMQVHKAYGIWHMALFTCIWHMAVFTYAYACGMWHVAYSCMWCTRWLLDL
jgi:hypothetical protein